MPVFDAVIERMIEYRNGVFVELKMKGDFPVDLFWLGEDVVIEDADPFPSVAQLFIHTITL